MKTEKLKKFIKLTTLNNKYKNMIYIKKVINNKMNYNHL